jgi:hypothetical protein
MLNTEEDRKVNKYTFFFEQHPYSDIRKLINELFQTDKKEMFNFYLWYFDAQYLTKIADHKLKLANFLSRESSVISLPEDTKRIVFLLATYGNLNLNAVNTELSKELGSHFKIFEFYHVEGNNISWKVFAKRAFEIRQGYQNHFYLKVQDIVNDVLGYYKNSKQNDTKKLIEMVDLGEKILSEIGSDLLETPSSKPNVLEEIEQFYEESGRIKLDIDRLNEEYSYENIASFITMISFVCQTKLHLINKKVSLSNLSAAEKYLLNYFAKKEFDNLISAEELIREHKPLEPVKNNIVNQ